MNNVVKLDGMRGYASGGRSAKRGACCHTPQCGPTAVHSTASWLTAGPILNTPLTRAQGTPSAVTKP